MQNTILSQDELDFLLTGAVKDRPEQTGAAASGPAQDRQNQRGQERMRLDQAGRPSAASASPPPEAGTASAGTCGFPLEARLRFARLLQEALRQDGGILCLVRPEQDGAPPAEGWEPCAELVCAGTAARGSGEACPDAEPRCGLQAGIQIDVRLAQALLARELGAGSYDLAGRVPTRLEQALLENALRAVPGCLARALAGEGGQCRALGLAPPADPADRADGEAAAREAGFGFAVRLGSRAGRLCVALA
jgi:hypothetical protein